MTETISLIERLKIYADAQRVIEALRIANVALFFYANERNGETARNAIREIEQLVVGVGRSADRGE